MHKYITTNLQYVTFQEGTHCWCGNSYGQHGAGTECLEPCAGNSTQICGGHLHNSVYRGMGCVLTKGLGVKLSPQIGYFVTNLWGSFTPKLFCETHPWSLIMIISKHRKVLSIHTCNAMSVPFFVTKRMPPFCKVEMSPPQKSSSLHSSEFTSSTKTGRRWSGRERTLINQSIYFKS